MLGGHVQAVPPAAVAAAEALLGAGDVLAGLVRIRLRLLLGDPDPAGLGGLEAGAARVGAHRALAHPVAAGEVVVTEGTDKPLKYPHMFAAAGLVLINKVDLLPYVDFDLDLCAQHARSVNPNVEIVPVSATKGDGMDTWYQWIDARASDASELPAAVAESVIDNTL